MSKGDNTYNIKDAEARSQIAALTGGDAVVFVGVSTTALTDGGSERPTVNGSQKKLPLLVSYSSMVLKNLFMDLTENGMV